MWDNSFWASGTGSWGNVTIGTGAAPYYGTYYPGVPMYGGYPYGGGATIIAGGDQWIILLGAVLVILLLLK